MGNNGMDSRNYIYLPTWVKWTVLLIAGTILAISAGSVFRALLTNMGGDSIVFFVSVAQSAALVIVFFLLVLFSRRDASSLQLIGLSEKFLDTYVVEALRRVTVPRSSLLVHRTSVGIDEEAGHQGEHSQAAEFTDFDISIEWKEGNDIFGRRLWMSSGSLRFPLWVGINVRRLFVIYFIPLKEDQGLSDIQRIFGFTFGGAGDIGYKVNFEEASISGERFVSIWMTVLVGDDFLTEPNEKLFWAQDIAMMTESLLRTALRNDVSLQLRNIQPAPL